MCKLFSNTECSSNGFDSSKKGHSCNCTFLFFIADKLGLLKNGISGKGVRGNPFYVTFK